MFSLTNPWFLLGSVLTVLSLMTGSFVAGVNTESNARDAAEKVALEEVIKNYVARVSFFRANAQAVSADLNKLQAARRTDQRAFEERLHDQQRNHTLALLKSQNQAGETVYVAGDAYVDVGLWNAALRIGAGSDSGDTGAVDAERFASGFAALNAALANLAENSTNCAAARGIAEGWQDLARKNGWVVK